MSPSPHRADEPRATQNYGASWQAIIQLIRSGSSWSGHERNCVFLNCLGDDKLRLSEKGSGPLDLGGDVLTSFGTASQRSSLPRFANISALSGLDFPDDGRALAIVDWDHDGDLDMWFRNRTAPRLRLMLNRTNQLNSLFSYVAVRLKGTTCNRDAVGARAELVLDNMPVGQRHVQSVRAGDAFLSQSSKWLHFGIRKDANSKELIVDWPGGSREKFSGISSGGRFEVTQGTGRATRLEPRPPVSLPVEPYQPLRATATARVVLPGRIALPTIWLENEDAPHRTPRQFLPDNKPTLITFWTSSCPHCRQELSDFTIHQEQLRGAGLNILAVCLDGLGQSPTSGAETSIGGRTFLKSIRFPFRAVQPTADSMDRVRHFQNALFSKYPEFVVPLSFLTDSQGQIVSIYRGAFSHEVFLQDRELVDLADEPLRTLASPLTGSWFTKPATPSQIAEYVAARLFAHAPEEGLRYYELSMTAEQDNQRQSRLRHQIMRAHVELARASSKAGDTSRATRHFQSALRIAPKVPQVHHDYGAFLMGQGDLESAEHHFRTALRLRPNYPEATKSLSLLIQQKGNDPGERQ